MTARGTAGRAASSFKARVLLAVNVVPAGRVVTYETLALAAKVSPRAVVTVLTSMNEDEREACPWHRAVAKGGAIG